MEPLDKKAQIDPEFSPDFNGITQVGDTAWVNVGRIEPEPTRIQKLSERIYNRFYGHSSTAPLHYLFYAIYRFGLAEGLIRYWKYELHPRNAWDWTKRRRRQYKLVDRRPKKSWHRTVYAVDRDGDLFLVECPQCHDTQSIIFNWDYERQSTYVDSVPAKVFQCSMCSIGFRVYLEDGLRRIVDHRDGVPPLPSKVVWDDNRTIHLGISGDAPWWWRRREIERDLHDGKDAHGHKPYELVPVTPQASPGSCANSCETLQPRDQADGK